MPYTNIDDPSAYFQTAIYTGAGSTVVTVTNDGNSDLQPDFLWFKRRDSAGGHALLDTSRGANVTSGFGPTGYSFVLNSNARDSEVADSTGVMTITSDGFTVKEMTYAGGNTNTGSMVAWQWHCNAGSTSSNTDGSITSTVQANQDAGFSIVTYDGNGSNNQTIGHGLGATPDLILIKNRNQAANWTTFHKALGTSKHMRLNSTNAAATESGFWHSLSTTLFGVKFYDEYNNSAGEYVAYCFAEKQGYSKFGKYVGNGNSNGPFVYTGFKPAFLIMKRTDSTGNWVMFDTKRDTHNVTKHRLFPNLTNADNTTRNYIDLLSNGFKMRDTDVDHNASGATIIYMAFAENPFVTSTGVPTTAR